MRSLLVALLILMFCSLGFSESVGSEAIEDVKLVGGSDNSTYNIRSLNPDSLRNEEVPGAGINSGFEINISRGSEVEIYFMENQTWAEQFIEGNQELYGGPYPDYHNITYSRGLFDVVDADTMESIYVKYEEDRIISEISENGTYYLVYSGYSSKNAYIDSEGNCRIFYGNQSSRYEPVEDCVEEDLIPSNLPINSVIYLITGLIGAYIVWRIFEFLLRKTVIWKLNRRIEKIEASGNPDRDDLERLYNALEEAYDGKYISSLKLMDSDQ